MASWICCLRGCSESRERTLTPPVPDALAPASGRPRSGLWPAGASRRFTKASRAAEQIERFVARDPQGREQRGDRGAHKDRARGSDDRRPIRVLAPRTPIHGTRRRATSRRVLRAGRPHARIHGPLLRHKPNRLRAGGAGCDSRTDFEPTKRDRKADQRCDADDCDGDGQHGVRRAQERPQSRGSLSLGQGRPPPTPQRRR